MGSGAGLPPAPSPCRPRVPGRCPGPSGGSWQTPFGFGGAAAPAAFALSISPRRGPGWPRSARPLPAPPPPRPPCSPLCGGPAPRTCCPLCSAPLAAAPPGAAGATAQPAPRRYRPPPGPASSGGSGRRGASGGAGWGGGGGAGVPAFRCRARCWRLGAPGAAVSAVPQPAAGGEAAGHGPNPAPPCPGTSPCAGGRPHPRPWRLPWQRGYHGFPRPTVAWLPAPRAEKDAPAVRPAPLQTLGHALPAPAPPGPALWDTGIPGKGEVSSSPSVWQHSGFCC